MGTVIVLTVLTIAVFFVVRRMIKDKKNGKGCCGGSCSGCSGCGSREQE